jgi:hypothetical protein
MKAAKFDYVRVNEAKEALSLLEGSDGSTKAMGGSQSLGPMLNLRLARPQKVIDVSSVADWRSVSKEENRIRVGAAVTHAEIEDGVFADLRGHMLQDVAARLPAVLRTPIRRPIGCWQPARWVPSLNWYRPRARVAAPCRSSCWVPMPLTFNPTS